MILLSLVEPVVRLGRSKVAGNGVFTTQRVSQGDLLTWSEPLRQEPIDPYIENWLDWNERIGCYSGANPSNRDPNGPLAHFINDCAMVDLHTGSVEAYKACDEANVIVVGNEGKEFAYARRNIEAGEELYRSYGVEYWLDNAESVAALTMQIARMDLRLVEAQQRGREIWDTCSARLAEFQDASSWTPNMPYRTFEGYGAYLWMSKPSADLRLSYAVNLGIYDDPLLSLEQLEALAFLHTLDVKDYAIVFNKKLIPPFGGDHFDYFTSVVFDQGKKDLLGRSPDLPW